MRFKTHMLAAAIVAATALPAAAVTSFEVMSAIDSRVTEISADISSLSADLQNPALTRPEYNQIRQEIQILSVRRNQLLSMRRVVPRFNERALVQLITRFDLDVSIT